MTLRQYLYVVRRWKSVIVAGIVIGLVVGWVSAPGTEARTTTFEATHTLFLKTPVGNYPLLYYRAPAMATLGAVPDRVATRLGIDRRVVQSKVKVETPPNKGEMLITARSTDRGQAEALANATAEELVIELGGEKSPIQSLEPAVAFREQTGIRGPTSRPSRAFLLGAMGLLLGVAGAFGGERLDNRIRSKAGAEEALKSPVMAEVPAVSRLEQGRLIAGAESSAFVEAYRGLRTSVDRWATQTGNGDRRPILVVTSPIGGEGKTTTVAHLAAALGEIGRSVVVISGDLRHPTLHLYFDRAQEPGLTDVLRGAPDARRLADLNLTTTVRGVQLVASGAPVSNPAPLLDHIGDHLRDARSLGDFVLVDAPPLLTTSDAADLARHADGVLVVVRAGRTSVATAARSAEMLERLNIQVVGTVLVGSERTRNRT